MPTSVPPRSGRGAACSISSSPASSEDEGAGKSSTFSLLPPGFHPSFPSFHRKEQEEDETSSASREMSISSGSEHHSVKPIRNKTQHRPVSDRLSPWEEWFLYKEKEIRARLQAQTLEEQNTEMVKKKEKEERERKKIIAEVKHKEWVQKKNEEVKREKRERELKLSRERAEKAAKELQKQQTKEEAKEAYEEWLKKKRTEDVLRRKEEKEKEKQLEGELQEKKQKSEKMFKEWLQNTRNNPRPASASYAYDNGKLTGYPGGNAYPTPAFCNPIPWKPIAVPHPKEEKVSVSTQVRLFGDNEDNSKWTKAANS